MLEPKLKQAFKKALERAGTQKSLEKKTGVPQSSITHFLSGRRKLINVAAGTLEKLFPEMEITFFRDEQIPAVNSDLSPAIRQIVQILNRATDEEQLRILTSIAAAYPQYVNSAFSYEQKPSKTG